MRSTLLISLFMFSLISCGSSSTVNKQIVVKQDAKIIYDNNESKDVKGGEAVEYQGRSMLVESPGHISVLVVPVGEEEQNIKVDLKKFDKNSFNSSLTRIYNKDLTAIFTKVHDVHKKVQEGKAKEALPIIEKLKEQYPNLTYLNFLKASVYYILGEKEETKKLLELALEEFPENEEALSLYSSLLKKGERNRFIGEKQ